VIPTRLGGCVESAGCVHQKFPRLQDLFYNFQSRSFYDPEGIHLGKARKGISQYAGQQKWVRLDDQSRVWDECTQPLVKEHILSFHPSNQGFCFRQSSRKGKSHLCLPSVLTVIWWPLRDGPRKSEPGPLIVSVDFQLSVLEVVAVLLRTAASFLVIVDQLSQLGDSHKYRREICQGISHRSMDDGGWLVWVGFGSGSGEVSLLRVGSDEAWMSWLDCAGIRFR